MEPTVRAIECVNEPEPVPERSGANCQDGIREWQMSERKDNRDVAEGMEGIDKRKVEQDGPASITTEPGRMYNQEVIKAISAR